MLISKDVKFTKCWFQGFIHQNVVFTKCFIFSKFFKFSKMLVSSFSWFSKMLILSVVFERCKIHKMFLSRDYSSKCWVHKKFHVSQAFHFFQFSKMLVSRVFQAFQVSIFCVFIFWSLLHPPSLALQILNFLKLIFVGY